MENVGVGLAPPSVVAVAAAVVAVAAVAVAAVRHVVPSSWPLSLPLSAVGMLTRLKSGAGLPVQRAGHRVPPDRAGDLAAVDLVVRRRRRW